MKHLRHLLLLLSIVTVAAHPLHAQQAGQLKDGDLVAICGDSITEQKDYSVNIQSYLLMCQPKADLQTVQFGWGGETSWGESSKVFNGDELAKGINLAAEFLQNPFSQPFAQVQQTIREQQNFETPLVKSLLHNLPQYLQFVPEEAATFEQVADRLVEKDKKLRDASSAAVKPVTHSIKLQIVD